MKYLIISFIAILGIAGISLRNAIKDHPVREFFSEKESPEDETRKAEFAEYWYAGLAELTGYELMQSRYGEIREGKSTLIFVTEPFSRKSHVKIENAGNTGKDNISVMKMNATRKFQTGIYPYSMMTSVFNPVDLKNRKSALKASMSGQEWCGQVFQQMNLENDRYILRSFSYFGNEGDQHLHINDAIMEDELFNLIRMDPDFLPIGEAMMIPSQVVNRFKHEPTTSHKVNCTLEETSWNGRTLQKYTVQYPHNSRTLKIFYQSEFPYIIEGWEDSYDGLISSAKRINTIQLDYWAKNQAGDEELYDTLYSK